MTEPLYLDASAFLRRVDANASDAVDAVVKRYRKSAGRVVSSRLLWLEARRVTVRERQAGNDISGVVEQNLRTVDRLPLTEDVWARAHAIEAHAKTLDSLHLATCALVGGVLLSFDEQVRAAAISLGIALAN